MGVRAKGKARVGAVVVLLVGAVLVVLLWPADERPAGRQGAATTSSSTDAAPAPAVGAVARRLLTLGAGPGGSAPVTLNRWRYRADDADRGRALGWAHGTFGGRPVRLPYSPNAAHVTGPRAARGYAGTVGWYVRRIAAPVAGRYALTFGSAHFKAVVYLDGRRVREHVGAYEPFTANLTLARGEHTVVVRVDWRDPDAQTAAGYARGWFNFGGLNRPVTLARLGAVELGALTVGTRLRDGRGGPVRVRIALRVRSRDRARRVSVGGALVRDGQRVVLPAKTVDVGADASTAVAWSVRVDDPALWSPGRPQRYRLTLRAGDQATLRRLVGLRELRWSGAGLRLNGRPLHLRGVGLPADAEGHGDAMTTADEARTVRQLVATGANATRSQLPLSESMLDRLDAAGILVWQEIGPWETPAGFHSPTIAAARDRALRTAELEQAHASVVAFTLTNELAAGGRPRQVQYVTQTARALRRLDGTRPIALDLWGRHLTRAGGPLFDAVDVLGVTDYTGWYEHSDEGPEAQAARVRERLGGLRALFPDKPIVVTELGAVGTPKVAAGAFGGERFQAVLLARRVRELRRLPGVSGALLWLLRDHALRPDFRGGSVLDAHPGLQLTAGLNEKGLYDYAGRSKPARDAVRDAFRTDGG